MSAFDTKTGDALHRATGTLCKQTTAVSANASVASLPAANLFESLPPELRNAIHEEVLVQDGAITLIAGVSVKVAPPHPVNLLALTAVSKSIRNDTMQLSYGANTFRFTSGPGLLAFKNAVDAWYGVDADTFFQPSSSANPMAKRFHEFEEDIKCLMTGWLHNREVQGIKRIMHVAIDLESWYGDIFGKTGCRSWRDSMVYLFKLILWRGAGTRPVKEWCISYFGEERWTEN